MISSSRDTSVASVKADGESQAQHSLDIEDNTSSQAPSPLDALKDRIKHHYNLASDIYYSLWGDHIHHSYYKSPEDTKQTGQINLIELLLELGDVKPGSKVLDVGCGLGGTSRYLAKQRGCEVLGITTSTRQVEIAKSASLSESGLNPKSGEQRFPLELEPASNDNQVGTVDFEEIDAEKMQKHFASESFEVVWAVEVLTHLSDKPLFFRNASAVLRKGGRLLLADWSKAPSLTDEQIKTDIEPIEEGMLLPPLCTRQEYIKLAEDAGLRLRKTATGTNAVMDISKEVAKTWQASYGMLLSPRLWAFVISQGRGALAFTQAFRAMRQGYANGTCQYAVMAFEKA